MQLTPEDQARIDAAKPGDCVPVRITPEIRRNLYATILIATLIATLIAAIGFIYPRKIVYKTVYKTDAPQGIAPQVAQVRGAVVHVAKEGQCQGSGCLISPDGIIFTAKHVTDGDPCGVYTVTLDDGKSYPVKYVLEDRENDVSFMKLDLPPGTQTPYAQLAQQDILQTGDPVIIAGSPLGKDNINTFSLGIISAVNRDLYNRRGWEEYRRYQWHVMIQSTSPAFPGNSGGPVFNVRGEVIGVLVAGMAETLNYSIPVARFRETVSTVRDWFLLCRLRPLLPDMRGPRGPQGPPGEPGPADPNHSGVV